MSRSYGHLVRLWGIHPSQLPEQKVTPGEITPYLMAILLEALPVIEDVPSAKQSPFNSSWKSLGSRSFRHSESPVHLYEQVVPVDALQAAASGQDLPQLKDGAGSKLQPERWFLRRSVHEDAAIPGTANWWEWVRCFKEEHAEAEKEFTPTVLSTTLLREWDCRGVEVVVGGEAWVNWTLRLEESVHRMPPPLRNRVFPVLQVTAATREGRHIMIVQIAAAAADAVDGTLSSSSTTTTQGHVRGAYTSVERIRQTAEGIEWVMATTSDAKGSLPLRVQNMVMPGPIAKDVDMFLSWIAEQRHTEGFLEDQRGGASKGFGQHQFGNDNLHRGPQP